LIVNELAGQGSTLSAPSASNATRCASLLLAGTSASTCFGGMTCAVFQIRAVGVSVNSASSRNVTLVTSGRLTTSLILTIPFGAQDAAGSATQVHPTLPHRIGRYRSPAPV
jgi:hypothetical protein